MYKRIALFSLLQLFLMALFLGCADGGMEDPGDPGGAGFNDPPTGDDMEDIDDPLLEEDPQEDQAGNGNFEEQRAGEEGDANASRYEKTPGMKGGSEREERDPNPVGNFELQREFPNTVALRGPMDQNRMALTFDDGPDDLITPAVLDALDKYDVQATFFLMGERAQAHPEVVQRIVDEGHVIANHSWDHPQFTDISEDEVEEQINRTESTLHEITGHAVRMFRPPYGAQNEDIVRTLGEMNYSDIIWSQDSLDWKDLDPEEVADNILSDITYGAIVLQHSAGAEGDEGLMRTVEALDKIIPELQEDGIEFVTVDELLDIRAYR